MNHIEMFKVVIPNFDENAYKYDYWNGDYHYAHNVDASLIEDDIDDIKVLETGMAGDDYGWNSYVVFQYGEHIYKVDYQEGSHGYRYKIDWTTLKEVFPKTKQVTYYE